MAVMQGAETGSHHAAVWFVEPDEIRPRARSTAWLAAADEDATSLRAVIVSSLFIVLLAASLLFGGHAAIDPLLRMAASARDGRSVGDVVFAMPDGKFCRHMSFDNNTAEVLEGPIQRCPAQAPEARHYSGRDLRNFAWGVR